MKLRTHQTFHHRALQWRKVMGVRFDNKDFLMEREIRHGNGGYRRMSGPPYSLFLHTFGKYQPPLLPHPQLVIVPEKLHRNISAQHLAIMTLGCPRSQLMAHLSPLPILPASGGMRKGSQMGLK